MALHGTASGSAALARARELVGLVGLPERVLERYPHELSGGMRQRAGLAMALACEPKVLLADEPTTGLDVMVQAQILELLTTLSKELGLALLLVTHDLPALGLVCERVKVMYAGQVAESGPLDHLLDDPRHPYTRMLFAATPDIEADTTVASIPGAPPRLDEAIVGCPYCPRCDVAMAACERTSPLLQLVDTTHEAACLHNES
jgi:peptide/nickel transport system ATP-binding protein